MHAKELVAIATGAPHGGTELERKEPVLDTTARQQLADRLREIAAERERATAVEDFDRAAALDDECERLATELSHNRTPRRGGAFADAGEKARKAVSKAISEAIDRIRSSDLAPLAGHLADRIRKGQWLSYSGSANWHIDHSGPLPRK